MFQPIDCVQTNVQPGFHRFDRVSAPPLKRWRCDLTGLSHSYNLYFVACNDEVRVYTPSFPTQELPSKDHPVDFWVSLCPPVSSVGLQPGIDFQDPHSITRLHIDYLGNEEILLVACDDGDVVGWRVSEIYRLVSHIQQQKSKNEDHTYGFEDAEPQIRVFLHRNVGASAWGLAVHREARMIAISANTEQVTVIAFALTCPVADSDEEMDSSSEDIDAQRGLQGSRSQERIITLRASNNIPAVHFDQGNQSGRWLFSSSIDGENHLWDLWKPDEPARVIRLGYCVSANNPPMQPCRCDDRSSVPHASWGAIFVDPRACHRTTLLSEACGPGYENIKSQAMFYDITETKVRFDWKRGGPMPSSVFQIDLSNQDSFESFLTDSDEGSAMSLSGTDVSAPGGSVHSEDDSDADSEEDASDHMSDTPMDDGHGGGVHLAQLNNGTTSVSESPTFGVTLVSHPLPLNQLFQTPAMPENIQSLTWDQYLVTATPPVLYHTDADFGGTDDESPSIVSAESHPESPDHEAMAIEQIYSVFSSHLNTEEAEDEIPPHIPIEAEVGMSDQATTIPNLSPPSPPHPDADISDDEVLEVSDDEAPPPAPSLYVAIDPSNVAANVPIVVHDVQWHRRPAPTLIKLPHYRTRFSKAQCRVQSPPSRPCIIVTKNEIYLVQHPFEPGPSGEEYGPVIVMQNPLFPPLEPRSNLPPSYHRNCYTHQIPELGIFIVASPAGRVGIFSLTHYTPPQGQSYYAFRLDHILPSRQKKGKTVIEEVWGRRMVGIAVGPVQGMLNQDAGEEGRGMGAGKRRWRLMLHFEDHTIYSYELGKYGGGEAPGLGELVV